MKHIVYPAIVFLFVTACGSSDNPAFQNSPVKGFWFNCVASMVNSVESRGRIMEFTDTEFRIYSHIFQGSNSCAGSLTFADTIQTGNYEVLGTSVSAEGLPIYDLKMRVLTVLGSELVDDTAFDQYFYVYIDSNNLYAGIASGEASFNGVSKALDLDVPFLKR